MKTKYQKTKPGYTFVELIISMVILFLAVMVVGSIFPASFKSLLKSKQVTIATTLAQQKLEQCLINPKDYRTRVGGVVTNGVLTGNFGPDHPEYSYSIFENIVTDKLKELKVEVYKLINGKKGIIDAATAQLVQSSGGVRIYTIYPPTGYQLDLIPPWTWRPTCLAKTITFPEDGVCIVDATWYAQSAPSNPADVFFSIALFYDGERKKESGTSAHSAWSFNDSINCVIKVTGKTPHIFMLYYYGTTGNSGSAIIRLLNSEIIIHYTPMSQIEVFD